MDKYDQQIERLTQNPSRITREWSLGLGLFQIISPTDAPTVDTTGCLTMIKRGTFAACSTDGKTDTVLTDLIREDERIPECCAQITVESLPVFAEWQRRIDKILVRVDNMEHGMETCILEAEEVTK